MLSRSTYLITRLALEVIILNRVILTNFFYICVSSMFSDRWEQQSRRRWKRGRFLRSIRRRFKRRVGPWITIAAHPPRAQLAAQVFCATVAIQWLHTDAIMNSDVSNERSVRHRFVTYSSLRVSASWSYFPEVSAGNHVLCYLW